VNVSPRQLNNADVPDMLNSALERHAISANLIGLEITESFMMAEGIGISKVLASLQKKESKFWLMTLAPAIPFYPNCTSLTKALLQD